MVSAVKSNPMSSSTPTSSSQEKHPAGLGVLFFTELWERFSFYGMRALAILFMTSELKFSDPKSYGIYGAYGALVWASPIIGGYIADHFLGARRAIFMGGLIIAAGHFTLALPIENSLFYGLAFLVVGTGFFKPNISSLLGQLYRQNDPRRDGGFTIFYMGINIGAFIAPILCGYVAHNYGWHAGFGLAGIGMLLGLLTLYFGRKSLGDAGHPPMLAVDKKVSSLGNYTNVFLIVAAILTIPVFSYALQNNEGLSNILQIFGFVAFGSVIIRAFKAEAEDRRRMLSLLLLFPFFMSYFACLEQSGGSMNLFAERNVDRMIGSFEFPTAWTQSMNPLFIMLLAPIFSWGWNLLAKNNLEPVTPVKFGFGLFTTGLGFYALILGIKAADSQGMVHFGWLTGAYFLITAGELMISPIALSMVTKLSPARFVSYMMGALFLAQSYSHLIAAGVSKAFSMESGKDLATDKLASLGVFSHIFEFTLYFSMAFGVAAFLVTPFVRKTLKKYN